jgi:acetyl-CoA carboxylase biotin carboxyl carrier protein
MDDIKITIKTGSESDTTFVQQMPMQVAPMAQQMSSQVPGSGFEVPAQPIAAASEDSKYITIKSPIIGTFYRKSAPDKPVFVEVGTEIREGDVLCVIEAMKLFNEIESEV